jgi:beta-1,4-N-acetylglucosaminyltransferase
MKLCLISSPGGHLTKMIKLRPWWEKQDRFWVTHIGSGQLDSIKEEKVIAGCFPENRNIINFFKNLLLALRVIATEKPDILVSMGAGIAAPFFLVGKLFGLKTIFIETLLLTPRATLTGKIVYPITDTFIIQNRGLQKDYPKAVLKEWQL